MPLSGERSRAIKRDDCRLCAEKAESPTAVASAARRLSDALPLIATVAVGIVVAFFEIGSDKAIGVAIAAGALSGALYILAQGRASLRKAHEAHAGELRAVTEDADGRVHAVITQFEWAVNDVARLSTQLEETKGLVRVLTERGRVREHQNEQLVRQITQLRERFAEIAMAASIRQTAAVRPQGRPVTFTWEVSTEGMRTRLGLRTFAGDDFPTRVRVMDRANEDVAVSGVGLVSVDGVLAFELEPPPDLIADLEAGRSFDYTFETLVADEWRPVHLSEGGRVGVSVAGVGTRVARSESRDAARAARSALN